MSFEAPKAENLVAPAVPDGYVFPSDRQYSFAPTIDKSAVTTFDEYTDCFMANFQPDITVSNINVVSAMITGVELHQKGYRMVMGALINKNEDLRTVSEILNMDFDCPNQLIVRYLQGGAKIAPYLLFDTPDKKPFYGAGVGLWMSIEQIEGLSS